MVVKGMARDELREIAEQQHGYVTVQQATEQGVDRKALKQMAYRGTLEHPALGVYRFPTYPVTRADPYMLAVLWTRAPEAVLSHETVLDLFGLGDVNPDIIHVTVGKHRRFRRSDAGAYAIHYEDIDVDQRDWWEEVPCVTAATAIAQCIAYGTPTYLLRQAIIEARVQGRITESERDDLTEKLEARNG